MFFMSLTTTNHRKESGTGTATWSSYPATWNSPTSSLPPPFYFAGHIASHCPCHSHSIAARHSPATDMRHGMNNYCIEPLRQSSTSCLSYSRQRSVTSSSTWMWMAPQHYAKIYWSWQRRDIIRTLSFTTLFRGNIVRWAVSGCFCWCCSPQCRCSFATFIFHVHLHWKLIYLVWDS